MTRLESMLGTLIDDGFGPLEQSYTDSWMHSGQHVRGQGITADTVAQGLAWHPLWAGLAHCCICRLLLIAYVALQVELEEAHGKSEPQRISLTVQGLTPHGFLRASDAAGHLYELHPDGNSLDFFAGLIRRKLPAA